MVCMTTFSFSELAQTKEVPCQKDKSKLFNNLFIMTNSEPCDQSVFFNTKRLEHHKQPLNIMIQAIYTESSADFKR